MIRIETTEQRPNHIKNILLSTALFFGIISFAQNGSEISFGPTYKINEFTDRPRPIGMIDKTCYFFTRKTAGFHSKYFIYGIDKSTLNLKQVYLNKLVGRYSCISVVNDKILAFYYKYELGADNSGKYILYRDVLDKGLNYLETSKKIDEFVFSNQDKEANFIPIITLNNDYLAVILSKEFERNGNALKKIGVRTYHLENLNLFYSQEGQEFDLDDGPLDIKSFAIDGSGSLTIECHIRDVSLDYPEIEKYPIEKYLVMLSQKHNEKIRINSGKEREFLNYTYRYNSFKNKMSLFGTYTLNNKTDNKEVGYFFQEYDATKRNWTSKFFKPFSSDFFPEISASKDKMYKKESHFTSPIYSRLLQVYELEDESYVMVFENYNYEFIPTANGGANSHHFGDLSILKIKKNGEVDWEAKIIRKFKSGSKYYDAAVCEFARQKEKLFFFYNKGESGQKKIGKNKLVLMQSSLNLNTGDLEHKKLFSFDGSKVLVLPRISWFDLENQSIYFGIRKFRNVLKQGLCEIIIQ